MINYIIFQIFRCYIVVLIDGKNRWKVGGVVDYRYLYQYSKFDLINRYHIMVIVMSSECNFQKYC